MQRLDNNFTTKADSIIEDVETLKSSQYSGNSNIVAYEIETNNTWDVDWTVSTIGGGGYADANINVKYISDTIPGAFCYISADIYVNGLRYYDVDYPSPLVYFVFDYQLESDLNAAVFQRIIRMRINAGVGDHIQIKYRVTSIDTGSLSVIFEITAGS